MRNTLLIITSVGLAAIGQLLIKKGMMTYGSVGGRAIWGELLQIMKLSDVLLGGVAFLVSGILWLAVLSKNDLSYAYPLVSLSYVLIVLGSWWFFKERMDIWKLVGIVLICLGVAAISQTSHRTAPRRAGNAAVPAAPSAAAPAERSDLPGACS